MINNIPYFVAEISANHCGSIGLAKKLIYTAKSNGADAVKLQTFTADSLTIKSKNKYFQINNGLWKNSYLWDLYKKAETPYSWHKELFDYAKKLNIKIFSTPFDVNAVDFLEKLKCPMYKIASFEMTDLELIKKVCLTKKPIIISTGLATIEEIEIVYKFAKKNGAKDITLLYCVSSYPSKTEYFYLRNLNILKDKFNCRVGLSDHSNDNRVASLAVSLGAEVFEKHIALNNQKRGLDLKFSLKGKEIKKYKEDILFAYNLTCNKSFKRHKNEQKSKIFRRSIFAIKNISKNEIFSKKNIRVIRPGFGASGLIYKEILGKKSPIRIRKNFPIPKKIKSLI